ncbi:MAG: hypothetical protein AAF802_13905 [Planctomycetota bacterium]
MIAPSSFNNQVLGRLLETHCKVLEGQDGFWHVEFGERSLTVITDEMHDRMRIITPVLEASEVDHELALVLLKSNFDRALDARYALTEDYLWSAFIHPLSPLDEAQLVSALRQVTSLAENFGTTFSSGELTFGGN